jgi:glycosyltransferase involved in cell wall biosynthesis/SAM-dependent methyltransferase
METETPAPELPWTGERYVPQIAGEIELEHLHRYHWAAHFSRGKSVLDIACGEGYGSEILARSAAHVIGVDLSKETVAHAGRKYRRENLEFLVGSCDRIPIPDGAVDLVVSFETIEHHDRHQEMMREIKRILSPKGILIISSPDKYVYADVPNYKNEFHVKELYSREFEALLKEHFANVCVLGQRVVYGSLIVGDEATRFVSLDSKSLSAFNGIGRAIFNVAIAADEVVPEAYSSIYEQSIEKSVGYQALQQEIEARGSKLAELIHADSIHLRAASARETEIAESRKTILALREEIAKALQEASEAGNRVGQLKSSLSWRITLPLRLARDWLPIGVSRVRRAFYDKLTKAAPKNLTPPIVKALFDEGYYTELNPSVRASGLSPVDHYLKLGWREGLKPHPLFDSTWYLQQNPDAAEAGVEPLGHYLSFGWREGRSPHPLFDVPYYFSQIPALIGLDVEPVAHFLGEGSRQGFKPHPLFDPTWYFQQNPDAAEAAAEPLGHYLSYGWREGRSPHPLFDVPYYFSQAPGLAETGSEPVAHFMQDGARQGLKPNPFFDPLWYARFNRQSIGPGENALTHYVKCGWKDGCDPHPAFSISLYLEANPEVRSRKEDPLRHFLRSRGEAVRLMPDILSEPASAEIEPRDVGVKAIALYLPQFHPVAENDEWWGQGFTEWTNVRRGAPQFWDHYQPHVPHPDIGYYDLNDASVMEKQAQMARQSGIYGFCFYYYWFDGRRLLNMPTDRLLSSGQPDFPFCFCWANENWTRRWDGEESEVLIGQEHSRESDERFIRDILPALRDRRYIRINGRPLIAVYRPGLLPDPKETFIHWREFCRQEGLGEVYLASFRTSFDLLGPEKLGLDAVVEFPPHHSEVPKSNREEFPVFNDFRGQIYDYQKLADNALTHSVGDFTLFRGVMPSWDNTARMQKQGTIWAQSNPQLYCRWLHRAVLQTRRRKNPDERLIFINSWNEWAEGAHLEPDQRHGYAWLNATRVALETGSSGGNAGKPYVLVISHDAAMAGSQLLLLNLLAQWKKRLPFAVRVICVGDGELRKEFEKCFPTLVLADFSNKAEQDCALADFLKGSPQVIYSSTVVNGPLLAQLRPLGIKIITHAHELQKSIERWAPGEIMAATLKCSDFFLAGSTEVADNLSVSHGVPKDRLGVVYDFIEPYGHEQEPDVAAKAEMRKELGIGVDDVVVFGCGTTDWRKGPDLFLEIARLACPQVPQLKFVWIGGDAAPYMAEVHRAGLEGRVLFLGNRRESRRYYYVGHIFLLSSREDPCPLVALEAADAGLPVVCFTGAGHIPTFVGEECGVAVSYEDVRAAAQAIARLASDSQLRRAQGEQGRKRALERHSSASAALQIEALFERLADRSPSASAEVTPRGEESLVSVIVPNYNHEKYLAERLRSITGQTYQNMEIILLDDASTDGSRAILEEFSNQQSGTRLLVNTENSGSTFKQWRKGLSEARGKYVWVAESDDVSEPDFLEKLVEKLEENPELSLAYCQLQMVATNGEKLGTPDEWLSEIDPLRWKTDFINDGIEEIRRSLVVKNTILNASGVVFRNFDDIAYLVDDSMRICADWLFWVRLLQRGGVAYVSEPLSRWRLNSSNARNRPPGELEWLEGERVLIQAAEILKLTQPERDRILLDFLRKCWKWRTEAT